MAGLIEAGETVALFLPIRDEIDTGPLFQAVRGMGGSILLPAIFDKRLEFRFFEEGDVLEDGGFETRQPAGTAPKGNPDLIVAPLAAYDGTGNRLGYGAGYYDGATKRLDDTGQRYRYCGLAFACQMLEAIPAELHDKRLDAIVTEQGVTWFRESS